MNTTDENNTAALFGALMGALPAARTYLSGLQADVDATNRSTRQIAVNINGLDGKVKALLVRGDMLRGMFPVVQDFQSGLVAPFMGAKNANVLAVVSTSNPPPVVAEERDVASFNYPPLVSSYDSKLLIDPTKPQGQLAFIGRAFTRPEVAAFLTGIAQDKIPSSAGLVRIFRGVNGLVEALSEVDIADADTAKEVFKRLFPKSSTGTSGGIVGGGVPGIIDLIQASSGITITNTTSETGWTDRILTIPAGRIPVGRILRVKLGVTVPSGNSTDTLLLKLRNGTTVSGSTVLVTGPAIDVGNSGDAIAATIDITRRADVGGSPRGQATAMFTGAAAGAVVGAESNLDFNADIKLLVTGTWGAGSASDQAALTSFSAELV